MAPRIRAVPERAEDGGPGAPGEEGAAVTVAPLAAPRAPPRHRAQRQQRGAKTTLGVRLTALGLAVVLGVPAWAAPASRGSGALLTPLAPSSPDAPLLVQSRPGATSAQALVPSSLANARRLADELRYEEAVVEYQRYLGMPDRPLSERAQATFELAFISLVLGDEVTARRRALEALELDTRIQPPQSAPRKWTEFLERMRAEHAAQVRVEILSGADADSPEKVRATVQDPRGRVKQVRLRHGLSPGGPYFATPMRCQGPLCEGAIPPGEARSFTAYYFVEAVDAEENTLATGAEPRAPLRVAILQKEPWYQSPWVWAGGGLGIVAAGALLYFTASPSR